MQALLLRFQWVRCTHRTHLVNATLWGMPGNEEGLAQVRTSLRIGIVGSSMAFAGSAALAALAPAAGAAGSYQSTATGRSGQVTINTTVLQAITETATPGNSPKTGSIGSGQVLSALQGVPTAGPALVSAFQNANPGGTDLVTASANADGSSAACAQVLGSDCTASGQPHPLVIKLGLSDLPATQLTSSLGNLTGASLVLTITGPQATCATGPGGSNPTANDSQPTVVATVLTASGSQVGPAIRLGSGQIFGQLGSIGLPSLASQIPLALTITPGSTSVGSGSASATAAEVGLSASGSNLFDIKSASASCGPSTPGSSVPGTGPGAPGGSSPSTTGEKPLKGIGTDEGRSQAPAAEPWLALNGMR